MAEDIFLFSTYVCLWSQPIIEVSSREVCRLRKGWRLSVKKGIGVWIFGFLTFLAVLHTFDAYLSLASGEASELLRFYPLNQILTDMDGRMYFWGSLSLAFIFFGVTSIIACHNPIMALYNKILADVQFAEGEADRVAESEAGLLDMINHSLTSNSIDLRAVKGDLKSVEESHNSLRVQMARLTSKLGELETGLRISLQRLEADMTRGKKCPFCGKEILPQFRLCPYCGEKLPLAVMQIEHP